MLKTPYEKPNVKLEDPIQKDLWKHLSLKSPDIPKSDRCPLSSRFSKENIKVNSSMKFFSNKSFVGQDRTFSSENRPDQDSSELYKLKTYLQIKSEKLKQKERQLAKIDHDLNKKLICFEEEKSKWCVHISLKLKQIESKEDEFEFEREKLNEREERLSENLMKMNETEKKIKKMLEDVKERMQKLIEAETNFANREKSLVCREERFEMKLEDFAGYERKVVEFEENLKTREEDLENIAGIIEEKKKDIEKAAEMFERINEQLKVEESYINSQRFVQQSQHKALITEKSMLIALEQSLISQKNNKSTQDHSLSSFPINKTERSLYKSPSFDSDISADSFLYNIRTPE